MNDIEKLGAATEDSRCTHIWEVLFEVLIKDVGDASLEGWTFDEKTVAAGPDAERAISKLKDYAGDPERYGVEISDLRVVGIRMLAEADIL